MLLIKFCCLYMKQKIADSCYKTYPVYENYIVTISPYQRSNLRNSMKMFYTITCNKISQLAILKGIDPQLRGLYMYGIYLKGGLCCVV